MDGENFELEFDTLFSKQPNLLLPGLLNQTNPVIPVVDETINQYFETD